MLKNWGDNSFTGDEIAKLILEIKKMRKEVNGIISDNSELNKAYSDEYKENNQSQ